jgi:hypothetical protein
VLYEDILGDETETVKPLSATVQEKSRELVFIHANGKVQIGFRHIDNIIDKALGEGEKMVVNKESLIGFSQSIKISSVC